MGWSNATAIIARMADLHIIGDGAFIQFITQTVDIKTLPIEYQYSITIRLIKAPLEFVTPSSGHSKSIKQFFSDSFHY